jgi:chaperonin cofactor prefoldin
MRLARLPSTPVTHTGQIDGGEGLFERTSDDAVAALESEREALGLRIDALMAEWEEVERQLAECCKDSSS